MNMEVSAVSLCVVILLAAGKAEENVNGSTAIKENVGGQAPWLPFFGINTFPYFSFSGLNLPQRPGLFAPQLPQFADRIKATKTEYIEITRRQTVHPVCFTTYENKSPCLPYRSNDEEEPDMDVDIQHQIGQLSNVKEADDSDMADYMKPVKEVLADGRHGKYLHFIKRQDKERVTSKPVELEGSESRTVATPSMTTTPGRASTEYATTTTVLLTKLEKYTDHRVTATMVALNCLPVDPAIRRCRKVISPIIEIPLLGKNKNSIKKGAIVLTPVIKAKGELQDDDEEFEKTVAAVKKVTQSVRETENLQRLQQDEESETGTLGDSTGSETGTL